MTISHPASTSHVSGTVLVGCAGWSIARVSAPHFPAEGSGLERYAAVMNCVEINSSFYRSHQPKTYAKWADSVPATFRFSVKLVVVRVRARIDGEAVFAAVVADGAGSLTEKRNVAGTLSAHFA